MPRTATEGRNTGRKNRTMTSENTVPQQEVVTNTRRSNPLPVMTIVNRPQVDVLDHGLEDYQWHYVWVNVQDPTLVSEYYLNDYRFVKYDDVKEKLEADERRSFLYQPDALGRVSYGEQNRLMRIPQEVYRERMGFDKPQVSAAAKVQQALEADVEAGKYNGTLPKGVDVTTTTEKGAVEHGETEKVTIEEGGS